MEGKKNQNMKTECLAHEFRLPRFSRQAFTLVELLVVIGIIALLISVLLPALTKARRAANTVACEASLRSIGQAMISYVTENNEYLPGSGNTTGRGLWTLSNAGACVQAPGVSITNIPGNVIQTEDWIGPLAQEMGISLPLVDGRARFVAFCNLPPLATVARKPYTPEINTGKSVWSVLGT